MPEKVGDLYGYSIDGKQILPCQFTQATAIEDSYAIVEFKGKKGILLYIPDSEPFSAIPISEKIDYYQGQSVYPIFELKIPDSWKNYGLDLSMKDMATEEIVEIKRSDIIPNTYSFKVKPKSSEQKYLISVISDNLIVGQDEVTFSFKPKRQEQKTISIRVEIKGTTANVDDKVFVVGHLQNTTNEKIATMVTMSGSKGFVKVSEYVSLEPNESFTIKSCFVVTDRLENAKVTLSAGEYGSSIATKSSLEPFY